VHARDKNSLRMLMIKTKDQITLIAKMHRLTTVQKNLK